MSNPFYVNCPHCNTVCEIVKLNCRIFRCGVYRNTMKQIHPHMTEDKCNELKNSGLIYGCSKPFRIDGDVENPVITICKYI